MKHLISFVLLACAVMISGLAVAAPVPATYDNPAWSAYIENARFETIPDGIPTGPGAVSSYFGSGFWPEGYLQIDKPYDLSNNPDLAIAESAKVNGRTFASESMRNFLIAVTVKFQKLIDDHGKKLPIQSLFYAPGNVPMRIMEEKTTTIGLGVFIVNGTSFEPVTDVQIHGEVVSKGAAFLQTTIDRATLKYQKYQSLAAPFKSRFGTMGQTEFRSTTQELINQADEELMASLKQSVVITPERVEQEKQKLEQAQKEIADAKEKIEQQYEKELDALRNQLLEDLNAKDKEKVIEEIRAVEQKKQAELKALDANSVHGTAHKTKVNPQERIANQQSDKRLTSSQRRAKYDSAATKSDTTLTLDERATWFLVEAILTQTDAVVSEIRMPLELKNRLVAYATKAKRDKKTIQRFLEITNNVSSGFEVSLACSARDRFLGCMLGGSPETEKTVSQVASAMLKSASQLPPERQMEIIQLVVNANPVELDFIFDTMTLRKRYVDEIDKTKQTEYMRLLTAIENIPIQNESAATRYRRLSKVRGALRQTDASFDAYFDDYLDDFSLEDLDALEKQENLENEKNSKNKKSSNKKSSGKKSKSK